jgi:hypothetical protein
MDIYQTGHEAISYVKTRTDKVILSFSGGKDSLCAWLKLRDHFEVVPIYHYFVPGLEFVEKYLTYCEEFFGVRVVRLPHPVAYKYLWALMFQPPVQANLIAQYDYRFVDFGEWTEAYAKQAGLKEPWTAVGTRMNDSVNRRLTMRKHGTLRESQFKFFPIADMKKGEQLELIKSSGLKLPADYRIWGRSYDGIDYYFLKGVRDNYPNDYQKILELYPLVDAEFARYEMWRKHYAQA